MAEATKILQMVAVLIETLWNVKLLDSCLCRQSYKRINRNIVECKGETHTAGISAGIQY